MATNKEEKEKKEKQEQEEERKEQALSLFKLNKTKHQKFGLFVVIFVSFLSHVFYARWQEFLIKKREFHFFWFYVIFNSLNTTILSFCTATKQSRQTILNEKLSPRIFKLVMPIVIPIVCERTLGIMCLKYLDYVTKVVFQSAKAIPVLIIGAFVLNKKFSVIHYVNAIFIALGVSLISLADAKGSANFDVIGILLIAGSVNCEALKSTFQERSLRNSGISPSLVVFWTNGLAFLITFPIAIFTGDLMGGVNYFINDPSALFLMAGVSLMGFIGTISNVCIIALSDAYLCTVVSSIRKLVTILLSVITFQKEMNWMHYLGILFSIGAVLLTGKLKKQSPAEEKKN